MSSRSARKIEIVGFNDLFDQSIGQEEKVIQVPLTELYTFKNHPFLILEDSKMEELVKSIYQYGVLVPGLVRVRKEGGYELISGHRRKRACELAGINNMPVIVKELNNDEATVAMVDANIQRENLLYSEKAFAYKMKFDAMKHQGIKGNKLTTERIGEENKDSGRQVQRYIRLTNLIPEILQMVDSKKIPFISAVELSYLGAKEQEWLLDSILDTHTYPSFKQAADMQDAYKIGKLTEEVINLIMNKCKFGKTKINIPIETISKYFPEYFNKTDILNSIIHLLEDNKKNGGIFK